MKIFPIAAALALVSGGAALAAEDALLARGEYLVNGPMACGNCHTPMTPQGPDLTKALAGGLRFDLPPFDVTASNITPDPTGIGDWSDAEIKRLMRTGVRPDGSKVAPIMPYAFYKVLTEEDLDAVVAYLRSLPPVASEVPDPIYRVVLDGTVPPGAEAPIPAAERAGDPVKQGFYIATIAHCMECHTSRDASGALDFAHGLGAGGEHFPGPWGVSVSANITSDPASGIGSDSDAEIAQAITRGIAADGQPLMPPMAYPYYRRMTDADVAALVAYLRTIPAVE